MTQKGCQNHYRLIALLALLIISSLACSGPVSLLGSLFGDEKQADLNMDYSGAEFLFEVFPFGTVLHGNFQHAIRWRVFSTEARIEEVNDHYTDVIPGWLVERDEIINGHRFIVFSGNHLLSSIVDKATFERVIKQNPNLDPGILDIEVLNSTAHSGEGRLNLIFQQGLEPQPSPIDGRITITSDTTLIILVDYNKQEVDATATPEPTTTVTTEQELTKTCQAALESSLCTNPYYPPIEGLTLIYQIDGHRTQIRQIGTVQTNIQLPGEPRMDSFSVTIIDEDFTAEMDYYCSEEGIIGGDAGNLIANVLEGQEIEGGQISVLSSEFEGLTLPNNISPGDTWESMVEIVLSAPEGVKLISTGNAQYLFEGYETMTVPAGTYNAQKIITNMDVEVTAELPDGHILPLTAVNVNTVSFNVECIGMVRSQGDFNIELVDTILP